MIEVGLSSSRSAPAGSESIPPPSLRLARRLSRVHPDASACPMKRLEANWQDTMLRAPTPLRQSCWNIARGEFRNGQTRGSS
jgi:hypothetical protein